MATSRVEQIYKQSGLNRRVGGHKYTDGETNPILRADNTIVPGGMDRARPGVSATPAARTTTPVPPIDYSLNPPSDLAASQLSFSSSLVTWTDNSSNETGFRIDRSENSGSSWTQIADVGVNVTSTTDTTVTTSSYWYRAYAYNAVTTSVYSATCSLTITSGAVPPPPEAPIFLMVTSGSAVLNWTSGSADADYYTIHKSLTGASGSYSEITTSAILTATDRNVTSSHTYWYKVAAVNSGGTSSFSNLAAIDILPCSTSSFYPMTEYGYVTFDTPSVYRNTYGVSFPFTTSNSQSISVWARSPDFDTHLTLVDGGGNVLVEDYYSGWQLNGETGASSAISYMLSSGSYTIELSSENGNIGRYYLYISPGPTLETEWSSSIETSTISFVPTSNTIVVGENGSRVIFYNTNTHVKNELSWSGGTVQGACYSPTQDRVYVWAYYLTAGQYTASIDELDNTGSYLTSSMFFRAPVNTFPNVDFSGYLSYDRVNDRILFTKYDTQTTQSVVVWDCATRTILAYFNAAPYRTVGFWQSCYSEVDNAYYIAQAYNSSVTPGYPMVRVDANTFAMSNTTVKNNIITSYISASNLIMIRQPGTKKVQFYDPLTDSVIHTQSDLPSTGLFEGGGAGDICTNVYVAAIDPGGSPNTPGVALLDRNTYRAQNYLALSYDTASSANGWYQYSIAFSSNDSKLWSAQSSYDFNIGRLYSIRLSRAIEPPDLPTGSFPPYPPSSLVTSSYTTSSITLGWTDNSSDELGFNLYRTVTAGSGSWILIGTVGPNTVSYTDSTPISGAFYNYKATAYNAIGESPYSNLVISASAHEAPPNMPTNVSVTSGVPTANDVSMSWTDNSTNELGFYVYRDDGLGTTVFTMSADVTNYVDVGVLPPPLGFYQYWVTAFNANGESGFEGPFFVF